MSVRAEWLMGYDISHLSPLELDVMTLEPLGIWASNINFKHRLINPSATLAGSGATAERQVSHSLIRSGANTILIYGRQRSLKMIMMGD